MMLKKSLCLTTVANTISLFHVEFVKLVSSQNWRAIRFLLMKFVQSIQLGSFFQADQTQYMRKGLLISILKFLNSVFQSLESVTGCNCWPINWVGRSFLQVMLVTANMVNLNWLWQNLLLFLPAHQTNNWSWWATGMLLQKFRLTLSALVLLLTVHLHPLKIQTRKFTESNSTLRFVTLFTVMTSCVTLPWTSVGLKVTGPWTTSLICRSKKSVKPSETNVSFLVFQVVLTLLLLGFSFKKPSAINWSVSL